MPAFETVIYRSAEVRADQVLLTLSPGFDARAAQSALSGFGQVTNLLSRGPEGDVFIFTLADVGQLDAVLALAGRTPGIRTAEPNYVIKTYEDPGDPPVDDPGEPPPVDESPLTDPGDLDGGGPVEEGPPPVTDFEVSNDPGFTGGSAWGLYGDFTTRVNAFGSQAGEAWAGGYVGSTGVALGVIDSGVDYRHADLYLNIWLNPGEIPTAIKAALSDTDGDGKFTFRDLNHAANAAHVSDVNGNGRIDAGDLLNDARWENGADNDGNGFIDDLIGWDFVNNDNDPLDDTGHGTHVAGIMAASGGNGAGSAGVVWSAQLVVAKILGPNGGLASDGVRALDYVTGVSAATNVVANNASWGTSSFSVTLEDAVERAAQAGILFVAAAGNGGSDQVGDNNDTSPNYPSNFSTLAAAGYEAVIAVAALTSSGALASFSNFGVGSVDLGAPGSGIYSTLLGGSYGTMSGTSMATPFVTGAIALYAAANPGASAAEIRADLLASTISTSSLAGKTSTGGRLDASGFLYANGVTTGVSIAGGGAGDAISVTAAPVGLSKASVFNDTLSGQEGADKLDGGPGADRLVGGGGDDTLTIDSVADVVVELANGGVDLVNSSISYLLPANLEKLTLLGTANLVGTGNELANTLTGNDGANTLSGLLGDDTLTGGAGADTLAGSDGKDRLTGGTGADSMAGGSGNDTYYVDDAGDLLVEAAGADIDTVVSTITYILPANVEKLTLSGSAAINGTGNSLSNTLSGNAAANVLSGGDLGDVLNGKAGNDTLVGDQGADKLNGGEGADRLEGGDGSDTYYVDDVADLVIEQTGQGNDIVSSSITYALTDNVERLSLSGTASVNGTGNSLGNTLTGNAQANRLSGLGGTDTLNGGAGDDTLDGGADVDRLTGGTGADRFYFAKGQAGDTISDFASGDIIELHGYGAGSTLTLVSGSTTTWTITDGVTGQTELLVLSNKYALAAADFLFT